MAVGFLVLLWLDHRLWFGGDEWAMVSRAEDSLTLHNVFSPHNEHWSTIPVVEYRLLLSAFGLRSYIPYLIVLIATQIVLAHLLWRLMRRAGVDQWIATILIAVFIVLGSGAQALQNAFNFSFVAAVCAGAGALLLVDPVGSLSRRRVAVVGVLLLIGLMCGPPAIPMAFAVGLLTLIRRGWRSAATVLVVPVVGYGVWFAAIGHQGTTKDTLILHRVPGYVVTGLANVFSLNSGWSQVAVHLHVGGTTLVGGLLGLGLLWWMVVHRREASGPAASAFVGTAAAVFFYVIVAFGRTRFGESQAVQTRYVFVAMALLIPILGVVLTRVLDDMRSSPVGTLVPVGCLALLALTNVVQLSSSSGNLTNDSRVNKAKVVGSAHLIDTGAPIIEGAIIPASSFLTTEVVRAAVGRRWFGSVTSVSIADRLDAQSILQVSATARPRYHQSPAPLDGTDSGGGASTGPSTCTPVTLAARSNPSLTFEVSGPSSVGLELPRTTSFRLVLESGVPPIVRAPARTFQAVRTRPLYLNFLSGGFVAKVVLPSRHVVVCGV